MGKQHVKWKYSKAFAFFLFDQQAQRRHKAENSRAQRKQRPNFLCLQQLSNRPFLYSQMSLWDTCGVCYPCLSQTTICITLWSLPSREERGFLVMMEEGRIEDNSSSKYMMALPTKANWTRLTCQSPLQRIWKHKMVCFGFFLRICSHWFFSTPRFPDYYNSSAVQNEDLEEQEITFKFRRSLSVTHF